MTLIVEDGTNVENANSYISVADADTYHSTYGNTAWADLSTTEKETSLIKATQAVELLYGEVFLGRLKETTQSRLYPRTAFYDNFGRYVETGSIPDALKNWVCEAGLVFSTGEEVFDANDPTSYVVKESVEIGGAIKESLEYSQPISRNVFKKANHYILPIITGGGQRIAYRG